MYNPGYRRSKKGLGNELSFLHYILNLLTTKTYVLLKQLKRHFRNYNRQVFYINKHQPITDIIFSFDFSFLTLFTVRNFKKNNIVSINETPPGEGFNKITYCRLILQIMKTFLTHAHVY